MENHLILFKHTGECAVTAKTVHALWKGQVDLSETKSCIWSNDDWRQVSEPMWAVGEVELPSWMDAERYCDSVWLQVAWKWFIGLGGNETFGKDWFYGLSKLTEIERLVCIKLLKTRSFKSEFRQKMRDHLAEWLNTDPEQRKYDKPFSPKQLACIITRHDAVEAKRLSNRMYWDRQDIASRWLTTEEAMAAVLQLDVQAKRKRFELWRKSLLQIFKSAGIEAICTINACDPSEVWSIDVEIQAGEEYEDCKASIFVDTNPLLFTVDTGFALRSVDFKTLREAAKHIALETVGDDLSPIPYYDKRQIPLTLP